MFNATAQQIKDTKTISLENEVHDKWSKNTTLNVGDSIVTAIEENRISRRWGKVNVKPFSGATIEDMYDYIKPLLKKFPKNKMLHNERSKTVLHKLLPLKVFVERTLPDCNICFFNLSLRIDNAKVSFS